MTAKKATATQIPPVLVRLIRWWGSGWGGACGVVSGAGWPGVSACGGAWAGCGSVVISRIPLALSSFVSAFPLPGRRDVMRVARQPPR